MSKKAIVYMPESCYNEMVEHIFVDPQYECGGFLIGNRIDVGDTFVFSIRAIYNEPLIGSHSRFELTIDYTSHAQDFQEHWQEEHNCDDFLVGTYHSHGTFEAFHSSVDDVYAKKFNLMIVLSPSARNIVVCYWRLGFSEWVEGELVVYPDIEKAKHQRQLHIIEKILKSGKESFPMRSFHKKNRMLHAKKKILQIGCGTLGNLLVQHIIDGNPDAELTLVDRDYYETANLPRSPVIDRDAVGKPKAFALAEAMARISHNLYPVHAIVADVRKLSLDFFEQFDVIVTPLDNLECRYYVSYCAAVLNKPLVNLGTSYTGLSGKSSFSGDVYYKPARSKACLDCFYPLYKGNEALLRKRISCGGALPEEVAPQAISSSMLIASLAYVCIKKTLGYDNSKFSTGYNISDVFDSENFFDEAPVRESNCCSFRQLHRFDSSIKTICISERTQMKTLYKCLKHLFKNKDDKTYELDMVASGLTHIKYRTTNPIHSIILDKDSVGRIYQLIREDYFPRDHVFAVIAGNETRYVRMKIK